MTDSMAKRLLRLPRVQEVKSSKRKGRPNLTQRCKRLATASTSTQVAVLPWRYMTRRWAPQSRYTLRRNTASVMKGLVLVIYNVLDYLVFQE